MNPVIEHLLLPAAAGAVGGVVLLVLTSEIGPWARWLTHWLTKKATDCLPDSVRERWREEQLAHLHDHPGGPLTRLGWALQTWLKRHQMLAEIAGQMVPAEAAEQALADAKEQANRILAEARARSERMEAESRNLAARLESDARAKAVELERLTNEKRHQMFARLVEDKERLEAAVDVMRTFERTFRTRLQAAVDSRDPAVWAIEIPDVADRGRG